MLINYLLSTSHSAWTLVPCCKLKQEIFILWNHLNLRADEISWLLSPKVKIFYLHGLELPQGHRQRCNSMWSKLKSFLKKKNFCQDIVLVSGLALSVALALFCCESGLLCRIEVEGLSKIYLRWIATMPVLRTVSDQKYSFINQKVTHFGSNCYNIESDWKIGFNPNASKLLLIYFTTDNIFSTQKWQFSSLYSANISLEGYK